MKWKGRAQAAGGRAGGGQEPGGVGAGPGQQAPGAARGGGHGGAAGARKRRRIEGAEEHPLGPRQLAADTEPADAGGWGADGHGGMGRRQVRDRGPEGWPERFGPLDPSIGQECLSGNRALRNIRRNATALLPDQWRPNPRKPLTVNLKSDSVRNVEMSDFAMDTDRQVDYLHCSADK